MIEKRAPSPAKLVFEYGGTHYTRLSNYRNTERPGWDAHMWVECEGSVWDFYNLYMSHVATQHKKSVLEKIPEGHMCLLVEDSYTGLASRGLQASLGPSPIIICILHYIWADNIFSLRRIVIIYQLQHSTRRQQSNISAMSTTVTAITTVTTITAVVLTRTTLQFGAATI